MADDLWNGIYFYKNSFTEDDVQKLFTECIDFTKFTKYPSKASNRLKEILRDFKKKKTVREEGHFHDQNDRYVCEIVIEATKNRVCVYSDEVNLGETLLKLCKLIWNKIDPKIAFIEIMGLRYEDQDQRKYPDSIKEENIVEFISIFQPSAIFLKSDYKKQNFKRLLSWGYVNAFNVSKDATCLVSEKTSEYLEKPE